MERNQKYLLNARFKCNGGNGENMKKNDFIAIVTNNNGTIENGVVNITRDNYDNLLFDIDGLTVNDISKNHKTVAVNNKLTMEINIIKPVKISGGNGVKSKNATYHVVCKKMDEKNETINDDLSTRDELVTWLKSLNKKTYEYIRIYDNLGNVCRKSAWIERNIKNA